MTTTTEIAQRYFRDTKIPQRYYPFGGIPAAVMADFSSAVVSLTIPLLVNHTACADWLCALIELWVQLAWRGLVSCGLIDIKFAPHEICSLNIPKQTGQTVYIVNVVWVELRKLSKYGIRRQNCKYCPMMNNDLVKMTTDRDCCSSDT